MKLFLKLSLVLLTFNQAFAAKLLKLEKKYCKDLRDCQTYFPCIFWTDVSHFDAKLIQQCDSDFVYDETKQECVRPTTKEDFDCLFILENRAKLVDSQIETFSKIGRNISDFSVANMTQNDKITNLKERLKLNNRKKLARINEENQQAEDDDRSEDIIENESDISEDESIHKRICIVTNWSQFRSGLARFKFEEINANLCNHIIYSSVSINQEDELKFSIVPIKQNDYILYEQLSKLKLNQPGLKTILRISDEDGKMFSKMARKYETRSWFIRSTIEYLNKHKFNGIDLDWQYPNTTVGRSSDKHNFLALIKEFKQKLGPFNILSITISPIKETIKTSYFIDQINNFVDFVNIESYDYYGPWDMKTGHSSPLYKFNDQIESENEMNINGTVTLLKTMGLSPIKMILGLAAYGRSFILESSDKNRIGALTYGGFKGKFTKLNGLVAYYEICDLIQTDSSWIQEWDQSASVPFIYNEHNEWISYENEKSLRKKIKYVIENGLGGMFVNSIDMDDFSGEFCSKGPYPFLSNSLGLLLHLDKIEKNITFSVDLKTATTKTITINKKPKNNIANRWRLNKYKIFLKPNDLPTTPKQESKINGNNNYLEPIESQEEFIKEQTIINKENLDEINEEEIQQQLKDSLAQEQEQPQENETEEPIIITTEATPLQFYFTNKESLDEKVIRKVNSKKQMELNKKIIEHLKAKQSETRNEWLKLQKKHKKQELLLKNLLEQLEKPINIQKSPKLLLNKNKIELQSKIVTKGTTTSKKPVNNLIKWEPKPINHQTKSTTKKKTTTATTTLKFNINKCYNKKNGIYRDEFNCSAFYICEELSPGLSRMHKFNCPNGEEFNMQTCICDTPSDKTKCKVPLIETFCRETESNQFLHTTIIDTTTVPITTTPAIESNVLSHDWPLNCENKDQGLYGDPLDCTKFYYCQTIFKPGQPDPVITRHEFTCPNDLHFNVLICQCDWPSTHCKNTLYTYCSENKNSTVI